MWYVFRHRNYWVANKNMTQFFMGSKKINVLLRNIREKEK